MKSAVLSAVSALLVGSSALAAEEPTPRAPAPPQALVRVLAKLPKYSPLPATIPADRREIDRPRNTIVRLSKDLLPPEAVVASAAPPDENGAAPDGVVRLPRYEVQERRLPRFKDREILTFSGRVDLYLKRHPGLHFGNLFGLNRGIAAAMIAEQDTLDRRHEMDDLLEFQSFANSLPRPNDSKDNGDSEIAPPAR
ncbi:MAG: hypothetical protein ABIZ04_10265 [Opitutus sp.]